MKENQQGIGGKKSSRQEFRERQEALWTILTQRPGIELDWTQVRKKLEKRIGLRVTDVQLEYSIRRLRERDELKPPNELKIIGMTSAVESRRILLYLRENDAARRDREELVPKTAISAAAWHVLLGKCEDGNAPYIVMPRSELWPHSLRDRLQKQRTRAFASLAMDSGSTVRALIRRLLEDVAIPFPVVSSPFDSQPRKAGTAFDPLGMVTPTLLTNSPQVVMDVLGSSNQIDLRLIGGSVSGDSVANVGALAENCLSAWGYSGKLVGVDIAIVGARGFKACPDGWPGFTVMHQSQAQMKMRFFDLASIRCVVMSSSKLPAPDDDTGGEGMCRFARLDAQDVDLVFIDGESADAAAQFAHQALRATVMPVVAARDQAQAKEFMEMLGKHTAAKASDWITLPTSRNTPAETKSPDDPDISSHSKNSIPSGIM